MCELKRHIVKVFTISDSIKQALELMFEYPMSARPIIYMTYRSREICLTYGTLYYLDLSRHFIVVILDYNYDLREIEIPLIEKLEISDVRMKYL